jgi:hypothetical protein
MRRGRGIARLVGMAALFVLACSIAPAQTLHLPTHEKVVLKNGLTVLLLGKHGVPLVNISAIVKAGAGSDPAGEEGLATTTAGLLRKGTKKRSAQQFAADLDYIGGEFEAEAGPDFTASGSFCRCVVAPHVSAGRNGQICGAVGGRRESGERRSAIGDDAVLLGVPVWNKSIRTPNWRG